MLHIVWLILKWILILLGIFLGILVAVLLLLLFCPLRYRAEAEKKTEDFRSVEGTASVSWLFRGLSFQISRRNGAFQREIKIFGISIAPKKQKEEKKPKNQKNDMPEVPEGEKIVQKEQEDIETNPGESSAQKELQEAEILEENIKTENKTEEEEAKKREPEKTSHGKKKEKSSSRNKKPGFLEKLKRTFRKWSLTIRNFYAKIDWWKEFLSNPKVQESIRFSKKTLWRILKHIFPTKIEGNLTFGSEDPAITGAVLAILGMTMPFHKNCIEVHPLFDGTDFLEGQISLKGRIYGIVFVKATLEIYFNKNIKYMISRWKHKEG